MLPTVDFCFKELMNNENIRKGIIAAILNLHPEEIEKADLMLTILRKEYEDKMNEEYTDLMEIHMREGREK